MGQPEELTAINLPHLLSLLHNKRACEEIISKGGKLENIVIYCPNSGDARLHPSWDFRFEKVQITFNEPFKPIKIDERILENIAKESGMIVENYPIPGRYEFSFYTAVKKLLSKKKYSKDPVANVGPHRIYFDFSTSKIPGYTSELCPEVRQVHGAFHEILCMYLKDTYKPLPRN